MEGFGSAFAGWVAVADDPPNFVVFGGLAGLGLAVDAHGVFSFLHSTGCSFRPLRANLPVTTEGLFSVVCVGAPDLWGVDVNVCLFSRPVAGRSLLSGFC